MPLDQAEPHTLWSINCVNAATTSHLGAPMAADPDPATRTPFTWWTVLFPWVIPALALTPRGRYPDTSPTLARLETWRGWLTLAMILILVVDADPSRLIAYPGVVVFETFGAMVWTLVIVTVIAIVSVAVALPASGAACLPSLLQPVWRILFLVIVVAGLLLSGLIWYRDGLLGGAATLDLRDGPTWGAIGSFVGAALLQLWILLFLMACVYQVAKNLLAVADASPLLPPIATLGVTWTLALGGLITGFTGEIPLLFPAPPVFLPTSLVSEIVTWTSLAALTVLCALQVREAARSWSLRHGPWR